MPNLLTPAELAAIVKTALKKSNAWRGDPDDSFCGWEENTTQLEDALAALLRHIAALEARTPAPADDPEMDGTDFAHPAWWRGHDHTTAMFCHAVNEILDGKDDGVGVKAEGPLLDTRKRLLALMGKPAHALPANMEALLAEAECFRSDGTGRGIIANNLATALRETLTREQAERARAEKAEAERDAALKRMDIAERERDTAVARLHAAEDLVVKNAIERDAYKQSADGAGVVICRIKAERDAARKELARLGPVEREQASPNIDMWWPERVTDLECRTNRRRAIRRVLEGGAA